METMEQFFDWAVKGLLAVIAFFVKHAFDKQAILEEKFNTLHEIYMKKDDFRDFKEELWRRLDIIEDAFKNKK